MKKILAFILAMLIMLAACSNEHGDVSDPNSGADTDDKQQNEVSEEILYLRENFPTIDGSTSLIPIEAGIRAAIFDKTFEEAKKDVSHTTTWGSFDNLLSGNVDMIFSCPLSEVQEENAAEQGIELETVPVAYEGFVFVVNASNPVSELTQDELKKIYSGEITNWKEVGGNDAEIIAYQRNNDSGSQNYMIEFMGDVPLMEAPTEKRPGSMAGLMDALAINDNAENAIGYSVYAYAADMYGEGDEIKFIKVDGAEVTKNSMAKGEYPLLGYNYAVFNADEPEDSPVRRLVDWMLSDDGQLAVAKAGYVTVRDIGYDYSVNKFEKYDAVGTGVENTSEKLSSSEYVAIDEEGYYWFGTYKVENSGLLPKWNGTTYSLKSLKNKELEEEINDFIADAITRAEEKVPELKAYVDSRNSGEWEEYVTKIRYMGAGYVGHKDVNVSVKAENGYIWAEVTLPYMYNVQDGYEHYYYTETATWDLKSGNRLDVTDLFYKGTDIAAALNKYLSVKGSEKIDAFYSYKLKTDYTSLPKDGWSITPDGIYFDYGNPFFEEGVFISFDTLPSGNLVTEIQREMDDCFDDSVLVLKRFRKENHGWDYEYIGDGAVSCSMLPKDSYPTAEKINSDVKEYVEKYYKEDDIRKYFSEKGYTEDEIEEALWWSLDWRAIDYGGKYIAFDGSRISIARYDENTGDELKKDVYPYDALLIYDIETGERIEYEDMLTESGIEKLKGKKILSICFDEQIYVYCEDRENKVVLKADDIKW